MENQEENNNVLNALSSNNPFIQKIEEEQAKEAPVEQPKEEEKPTEQPKEEVKPAEEEKPVETPKEEEPSETISDSPWAKSEDNTNSFESFEDFQKYLNKEAGYEGRDAKAFVEDFKALKTNNEELSVEASKAKDFENYFTNLEPDLFSLLLARNKGEDYVELAKKIFDSKFDFTKDFSNHSEFQMLNHYYPGKFSSKEDYQAMKEDEPERYESYVELAEGKYNKSKSEFKTQRQSVITKVTDADKEYKNNLNSSLSETISYFKKEYPQFNEVQMKDIGKTLEGGQNALLGLFFDSNGLLKEDAAEAVALVKYGKSEIAKRVKRAANKATSKTNEEIISRAKDKPTATDKPASETSQDSSKEEIDNYMKYVAGKREEITFK